jgi:hypothetical protein
MVFVSISPILCPLFYSKDGIKTVNLTAAFCVVFLETAMDYRINEKHNKTEFLDLMTT